MLYSVLDNYATVNFATNHRRTQICVSIPQTQIYDFLGYIQDFSKKGGLLRIMMIFGDGLTEAESHWVEQLFSWKLGIKEKFD